MANNNQLAVVNENIKAMKGLVRSDSLKKRMEGVLGVYPSYITTEDEAMAAEK